MCLKLHTAVLAGHAVCSDLALPPSTRVLALAGVMRDARTLNLASMLPRLHTVVLGMGHLPASLPPTVERLAVVGEAGEEAAAQAAAGLAALLPHLPRLKELRFTTGADALPEAVAAVMPPGCQHSTARVPAEGPASDVYGRSLHLTAPLHVDWCDSLLTAAGLNVDALEAGPEEVLLRQVSRKLVS